MNIDTMRLTMPEGKVVGYKRALLVSPIPENYEKIPFTYSISLQFVIATMQFATNYLSAFIFFTILATAAELQPE